jgi:hypothetical protein
MAGSKAHERVSGKRGAPTFLISAVAAAPLLASVPAAAQWFGEGLVAPRAVARIVMQEGYSGFSPPRLAGDVYIVHAVDVDGARVRLVIDAHDGRILRPVRSVEQFAPPRRLRPQDEASAEVEYEIEREDAGRFGTRRMEREALVPPRSIGREPSDALPREAGLDLDREPAASREPPAVRQEPAPKRKTVRVEQPARQAATPAKPARSREANRPAPAVTPPAPAPVVDAPKPQPAATPATTAAAPAPAVLSESAPATPAAPAPAIEAAKPEPNRPAEASGAKAAEPPEAKPAAEKAKAPQPAATASASGGPVRVIEGVTPVPAPAKGASNEPNSAIQ